MERKLAWQAGVQRGREKLKERGIHVVPHCGIKTHGDVRNSETLVLAMLKRRKRRAPLHSCTATPSGKHEVRFAPKRRSALRFESERFQEGDQRIPVRLWKAAEFFARRFGFAAVPKNRLGEISRAPIVQEAGVAIDF